MPQQPAPEPARPTAAAPPAAGSGGQWWCYRVDTDSQVHFTQIPGSILAGFAGIYSIQGPFDSLAAAQQQCGAPSSPGAPPPPPPSSTPPPAAPPPPTPPQSALYWYVVCIGKLPGPLHPEGIISYVVQAYSQSDATAKALALFDGEGYTRSSGGFASAYGPFDSQEAATAAQPQVESACHDAAGTGKQKPCNYTPLIQCPPIPPDLLGLGTPGTADWCKALDAITSQLGAIGNKLFAFIDDLLNSKTRIDNIDGYINDADTSSVAKSIASLIRQVFCWLAPYIETARQGITCLRQWLAALFPKCNTAATFGLVVIRSFLVTLERFEWGSDAAVWVVAASGMRIDPLLQVVEYLIAYSCPQELPREDDTVEAYKYNILSENVAKCILQAHGVQWDTALPGIIARGDKPGWKEALQYVRRFQGSGDDEDATLRNLGVLDSSYRDVLRTVYDELPTVSDHMEWLRKNVFDSSYVRDFRLLDGFGSAQDLSGAGWTGYVDGSGKPDADKFWQRFGADLNAQGMLSKYAALHYAAHWVNPSFAQQFAMVQRLRAGRVSPALQFSRADLLRTMQEMDVSPYFRERLEAVSHPVPNLTLCLQMYQYGTIDGFELVEKLQDLGYSEADAKAIGAQQDVKVRRLNASAGHGWTPNAMAPAYAVGKLTARQVYDEMTAQGYSKEDADRLMRRAEIELATAPIRRIQQTTIRGALTTQERAYRCGAISAEQLISVYANAGIPDSVAQIAAANVDSAMSVSLCDAQIKTFKSAVTSGKITLAQAAALMDQLGIPQVRKGQYLQSWALEVKAKAPQASAARILRWVAQGLLDREVAAARLQNLGWTDPDLTLSLAESLASLSRLQNRNQALAARSQQAAARAALKAARDAESTARQLRSKLRGIASRPVLQKWYKEGLIDDTGFIDYMQARGYDDDSTLKYLAEAQGMRIKAQAPPKPKAKPTVGGNGTAQGQS